jgi:Secretion system C-terminal sorting domain
MAETTISFILPESDNATLSIYDVNGREVYTLKQSFNKGYNEVKLDNTALKNSGIYFYRL